MPSAAAETRPWVSAMDAGSQSYAFAAAAAALPPPLPLQPTLSEWSNLGLEVGLEEPMLPALPMRRTRSRGLPSAAAGTAAMGGSAMAASSAMAAPPPPPMLPALPMMPSLSEAALAIGLDMNEAVAELQGVGQQVPSPSHRAGRRVSSAGLMVASAAAAAGAGSSAAPPPPPPPPVAPLQGSPMRRTRSRGGVPPALPMTHSVSELVSSFLNAGEEADWDSDR